MDETAEQIAFIKMNMRDYIKSAILRLEHAMNLVETDDNFDDGQSEELDKLYDRASAARELLITIKW